jgi:hypothetical protein
MWKVTGWASGILLVFMCAEAQAASRTPNSCSNSDVQNAINLAVSGDTVLLPSSCSVTWNGPVSIPSTKGITLDGNGANITRGVSGGTALITLTPSSTLARSRITGFAFTDSSSSVGYFIVIDTGNETSAKFRIDHCTFTGLRLLTHIRITAPVYGLIDHDTFTWSTNNEIIHNEAYGGTDAGWRNDVFPGSDQALYVEDSTFVNQVSGSPAYFLGGSATQGYYGSRTVFRYNSVTMAQVDQHGTAGNIGARWWEIYENTFIVIPNGNQDKYMDLRAGSGVVFNNHLTGAPNQGNGGIVLREEDSGWPALYQVGRGKNQTSDPAFVWGNDPSMPVQSGSSNVLDNRDFFQMPKPGYTPYIYPHPLQTGTTGAQPPQAPSNLRIVP